MHSQINAAELKDKLEKGEAVHLVDVREAHEHEEFNIGGIHVPLGDIGQQIEVLRELSQTGDLVLYCRSGNRSLMAQRLLGLQFGIQNTHNLIGGVLAWKEEFPE